MTHDIRGGLDRQLDAAAPPSGITADAMVAKGRKRAVAQRFGIAGGLVAGVAGLTAGVLALSSLGAAPGGQGGDDTVVGPAADQRYVGDFPYALDQAKGYAWDDYSMGDGSSDEDAQALADALWDHLQTLEGVDVLAFGGKDDGHVALTEENYRGIKKYTQELYELVPSEGGDSEFVQESTGYKQSVYSGGDFQIDVDPGDGWADWITVDVAPKGGYLSGAGVPFGHDMNAYAPYLVPGCDDTEVYVQGTEDSAATLKLDCDESTTPDGERVLTVVRDLVNADGSGIDRKLTTVLYNENGTATVVSAQVAFIGPADDAEPVGDEQVGVTADQLLDIAQALPTVEVK